MKAAVHLKYGLPGDIGIQELDIPVPKNNEVLVRVYATTVNRSDCHVLSGKPLFMRLFTGLFKPRATVTGSDFAGEIAAVGSAVRSFKAADKVMGFGGGLGCGAHAQYFTMTEVKAKKTITAMPFNLSYDEAAACLEGAVYAGGGYGFKLQPGQKAMVYGATGAIGTACVQFFKNTGAYVTAVCRDENGELIRSLGADKIVDYTKQDFTNDNDRYDFIFDAAGKTSFFKCRKLLNKNGRFTSSNGAINLLLIPITKLLGGKKVIFPSFQPIKAALDSTRELIEKGKFKPVIDRKYPLEQIAEAFRYVASGQKIGNVVITMDN